MIAMLFCTLVLACACHVVVGQVGAGGGSLRDLRARLAVDQSLRMELIRINAELLGKSLFSDRIQTADPLFVALLKAANNNQFGVRFTVPEAFRLLFMALKNAPREETTQASSFGSRAFSIKRGIGLARQSSRGYSGDPSLVVSVREGKLMGVRVEQYGVKYVSFLEIPYATVTKRFRGPKPAKPWKGIRFADAEKTFCPQKLTLLGQIAGNEDCLYLNVHIPDNIKANNVPVFVWLHGGAFAFGLGNTYIFKPHKILAQGLIVVSFNYRLGPLGFLSTGTKEAPGNAGMKDMVAALRWIRDNIRNFGGDPNNVVLYGVSSGAIAVEYLALSPMAKGLFSKAIVSSGSICNDWAYRGDPLKYAFRLGRYMGSNATHVKDLVRFFKRANSFSFIEAAEKMTFDEDPSGEFRAFLPTAESQFAGEETFLSDHPENILKSGQYYQVPYMLGFSVLEGSQMYSNIAGNPDNIRLFEKNLEYYLPSGLLEGLQRPEHKRDIMDKIKDFYFGGRPIGAKTKKNIIYLLSDAKFLYDLHRCTTIRLQTSSDPIYYSEFAFEGDLNTFKNLNDVEVKGAGHADDLAYVLEMPFESLYRMDDTTSKRVSLRMVTMMANFMRYGQPIPTPTKLLPATWNPIRSPETMDYLEITDKLVMKTNPNQMRYNFWKELYRYKKYLLSTND